LVLVTPGSVSPPPPEVEFADLAQYALVLPAIPNGLRTILEGIARRLRISLNVVVDTDSFVAQKQICQHCGYYLINEPHIIAEELAKGVFTTSLIVNPYVERYFELVTTQQRPLSRAAREVANRVTAILKQLPHPSG
jgi:LysR family nitrogen assimilation transcriptional regulator